MVLPVVMYGCESWTIKKAAWWRIDAFELWCWRRLLRVPWTARRSNQSLLRKSVLNIHWKDWCWSLSSNTLATWCEEPTHWKRPWCWERLRAGEGDDRGWDGWMASLTQWTWEWTLGDSEGQGRLACCSLWGHKELDMTDRLKNKHSYINFSPDEELWNHACFKIHCLNLGQHRAYALHSEKWK